MVPTPPDEVAARFGLAGVRLACAPRNAARLAGELAGALAELALALGVPDAAVGRGRLTVVVDRGMRCREGGRYDPPTSTMVARRLDAIAHEYGHFVDAELAPPGHSYASTALGYPGRDGHDLGGIPYDEGTEAMRHVLWCLRWRDVGVAEHIGEGLEAARAAVAECTRRLATLADVDHAAGEDRAAHERWGALASAIGEAIDGFQARCGPSTIPADLGMWREAVALDAHGRARRGLVRGYWQSPLEMFARAFESMVERRLRDGMGIRPVVVDTFGELWWDRRPYPDAAEAAVLDGAISAVVGALARRPAVAPAPNP